MPTIDIELRPVDHLTTDALGEPGKRVFYLHGWQGQRVATLIIEKLQLQTLAVGIEQFLACLLYTSDAADDLLCVDLGGRRILKKKKKTSKYI